jgi:NADH-quinone oxidoreductase subunit G
MKLLKCNSNLLIVPDYYTIMQACWKISIFIPRFCFHDKLSIAGNCRICLVELSGSLKPVVSCALNVENNFKIFTESFLVIQARKFILEFLLLNHPLDCPICDQGSECDLQDQTYFFGNSFSRFFYNKKSSFNKLINNFIKSSMNRCIHCTRCIRFSDEICDAPIGIIGRSFNMEISNYIENVFLSEFSGNISDLCPVGALLPRSYLYQSRSWEFSIIESIDISDSFISNITFYKKGLDIFRILPSLNNFLNNDWLSDRTRFMLDGFFLKRFYLPSLRIILFKYFYYFNILFYFNFFNIYNYIYYCFLFYYKNNNYLFYIGDLLDLETIFIFKSFINFKSFKFISFANINRNILNSDLRFNFLINTFIFNLYFSNIFFILGNSLRKELPILNIKLKNFIFKNKSFLLYLGNSSDFNYKIFHLDFITDNFILNFFFCQNLFCKFFLKYNFPSFFFLNFNFLNLFLYLFYFFNLLDFIAFYW